MYWNRKPRAGLWVVSLNDNSETFLYGGSCYPAGWSPDGNSIYANIGDKMLSTPAAGGLPNTLVTAPGGIYNTSVSADGKKIVYSVAEEKSDVWIVDSFDPASRR